MSASQTPWLIKKELNWTANGFQAVELEGGLSGFVKGLKARVDPTDNGGGSATLQVWIAQSDTAPTAAPADEDVFVRKLSISLGAGHATDAVYVDTFEGEGAPYAVKLAKLWLVGSLASSSGDTKVTFMILGRK